MTAYLRVSTVVVVLLFGLAATLLAQGNAAISAPTMRVGEFWEFKLRTGAVSRTEILEVMTAGLHAQSRDRFPGVRFIRDQDLTTVRIEGDYKGDPGAVVGWAFLRFPLHVGKRYTFDVVGAERLSFTIDVEVAAQEDVRTEAGLIPALRLDTCWKNKSLERRDCGMAYWYAPTAKAIIKRESPPDWPKFLRDGDFELVRFRVNS